jgi:AcrR family transcriptional regulator
MKSLDKDQIVEAAIAFIEENGLPELSMRRLAADLGVGTMTLYNHVPNKDALLNGVVQTILEEIEIPGPDVKPWAERVRFILGSFRRVAHRHPTVIELIPVNPPWTPPALRATEVGVAALKEAGFGDEAAAHAYRLLASYVVGYVSLELGGFFTMDESRCRLPVRGFPSPAFRRSLLPELGRGSRVRTRNQCDPFRIPGPTDSNGHFCGRETLT